MSALPDHAVPIALDEVNKAEHLGKKIRVVGIIIAHDARTALFQLTSGAPYSSGLLVDLSLCLVEDNLPPALKEKVMVLGDVEEWGESAPPPLRHRPCVRPPLPPSDPSIVLRALLYKPVPELDLGAWERAAKSMESAREKEQAGDAGTEARPNEN